MFHSLPDKAFAMMDWPWERIEPYVNDLLARDVTAATVEGWLADWSRLFDRIGEVSDRLWVATTVNTADEAAQERFETFIDTVYPRALEAEQALKAKLLASELEPAGFAIALRNMRADDRIFREENVALLAEQHKLSTAYDQIVGAQTVLWDGEEKTLPQLTPFLRDADRTLRERAWRVSAERRLEDRDRLADLWRQNLALRQTIAANAGFDNYRDYRWIELHRFDYTPEDCLTFHAAIEEVVVPAAARLMDRRKNLLGLDTVRHWDLFADPRRRPTLKPYETFDALNDTIESIFRQVDPELAAYYRVMRDEDLLDLENRKNKAPGGYMCDFAAARRPFIFTNAVGTHDDVTTLLHEGGHAFHSFEMAPLPYYQQRSIPMEVAEVASMAMELLAAPYLQQDRGGFYTPEQYAKAVADHLEDSLRFWSYMAIVDAFQHWVYAHIDAAADPDACDAQWAALWQRFAPYVDWSGLEREQGTIWRRQGHIYQDPFYYVEYGLAQLGAAQIWRNALTDPASAVASYRAMLRLGYTVPLPELFATAGARFAFDAATLREAVSLMERTIHDLESA